MNAICILNKAPELRVLNLYFPPPEQTRLSLPRGNASFLTLAHNIFRWNSCGDHHKLMKIPHADRKSTSGPTISNQKRALLTGWPLMTGTKPVDHKHVSASAHI